MDYISVRQAAEKWDVSVRQVQALLKDNRIEGATRFDNHAWMIPADTQKPGDLRHQKKTNDFVADLDYVIRGSLAPWPSHNPEEILSTISEPRLRLQYEGEFAYLRGDYERTIGCFHELGDDDAAKLRACPLTIATAISIGDYPLFAEIETYLKSTIQRDISPAVTAFAELGLNTAYVSAIAPSMVVDWLKDGDFGALNPLAKPDAAYKRTKYFQSVFKFESMLAVAQTTLAFCVLPDEVSFSAIYLRIICAIAYAGLGRQDEAKPYLQEALRIALPHGFITPFAESMTAFGNLLEQCLDKEYAKYLSIAVNQWQHVFSNWMTFHNRFTKENITSILSLREYHIAQLAAQGAPYVQIAEQFHISVGRLKTIMHEIYGKLFVKNRKELSQFIL